MKVWVKKNMFKILESLKGPYQQVLCVTKDFNNIVKWFQIHRSPISWTPKHNHKSWINNSLNTINVDFPK
jgi:beta-lactamase class D